MAKTKDPNPVSTAATAPAVGHQILFKHVLDSDQTAGTYSLSVECSVFENGKAKANQNVIVKEGISEKYSAPTDINGIMLYHESGTLGKAKTKILRFCLAGLPAEQTFSIDLPEKSTAENSDNDPESLSLNLSDDGAGHSLVLIRALKTKGAGLKTTVNIVYRGVKYQVETDSGGSGIFGVPDILDPGESFPLVATVPGIEDDAVINISRPRDIVRPARFSRAWFEINNGRAFLMFLGTVALWLYCLSIGPGEMFLNKMTFRNEASGLSSQEEIYNRSVSDYNAVANPHHPNQGVFPAQQHESSTWQHKWLLLTLFVTFFTIFYAIFSQREEIVEGIRGGLRNIFRKSSAKASDPKYEILAKWVGMYSAARKPRVTIGTSGSAGAATSGGHPSLLTLFSFDLLADFLVEILPSITRKIF